MNEDKEEEEKQRKVAFYLRVSTDEQADKFGLDAQRSAVEAVLKSKGALKGGQDAMVLAGANYVYQDEGVSGTTALDERPAFRRLKEDFVNAPVGNKPFEIVVVFKIDRLARKLSILMNVLEFFDKYKIEFISATESIDTSTPFGRAMLGILGVIAELERETIMDRTSRGKEEANQRGKVMGGNARYGYQKDANGLPIFLNEEKRIVEKIFRLFTVTKLSPQKIADILKEESVLSPEASAVHYGKRKGGVHKKNDLFFWRMETVRGILADEIYTGIRYYNKSKSGKPVKKTDWKLSPTRHEPIIPAPLFELAQRQLAASSARKTLTLKKQTGHLYLLSGLLRCNSCKERGALKDSEMSWTGDRKELAKGSERYAYYYKCNRKNRKKYSNLCPVVPIPAESLEDYVLDFVKRLLNDPRATYEYQKSLESTKLNIKALRADREQFQGMYDAIPQARKNILKQHEIGYRNDFELKEGIDELNNSEKRYLEKINEIDLQLSNEELSLGYNESLKQYGDKYKKVLEGKYADRKELYELIHMVIDQIIVYARTRKATDKIAGRKTENQLIPERIDIYLKLPQDLLHELYTQKFGVRTTDLYR